MAKIESKSQFDLFLYRYTLTDNVKAFDNSKDFNEGPNQHLNRYSRTREYFPVIYNETIGVIWQIQVNETEVFYTKFSKYLKTHSKITLPNDSNEGLAAASHDKDGNIYYLTIQEASGATGDIVRTATLYNYKWSNDNSTYAELGGVIAGKNDDYAIL